MATQVRQITTTVEIDRRNQIIADLEDEVAALSITEREVVELRARLADLENRHDILLDDKEFNERELNAQIDIHLRTIANLRAEIESLRLTLADRNAEIAGLHAELRASRDLAEQRLAEINRLKNELNRALDEIDLLVSEKAALQGNVNDLTNENRRLLAQIDKLTGDLNDLINRNAALERRIRELEADKQRLQRQLDDALAEIDHLNLDIKNLNDIIRNLELQAADDARHIAALEDEIRELERINEKIRQEAQEHLRNYQNEVAINTEIQNKLSRTEQALRDAELDNQDLIRELDALKIAHGNALETNYQLNQDLENATGHIHLLTDLNRELVEELERITVQDEQARDILDRRNRIQSLIQKVEQSMTRTVLVKEVTTTNTRATTSVRTSGTAIRRSPYKKI